MLILKIRGYVFLKAIYTMHVAVKGYGENAKSYFGLVWRSLYSVSGYET